MTFEIIRLIIVLSGLLLTVVLFYHFPRLAKLKDEKFPLQKISIIIPARNEEKNIALLFSDLTKQKINIHEIICVDDASEDKTSEVIKSFPVQLLVIKDKPQGWLGKSWACASGAAIATGDILLFIDADVRISPDAVFKLLTTHVNEKSAISVQPYHKTEKFYEQFSLIFNFIQFAGNGSGLPQQRNVGFFGPVIMISREDYQAIDGHNSVKGTIIEDVALGEQMKRHQIPYKNFIGDGDISFRMYSGGFRSLFQGWTKNMGLGAVRAPFPLALMVFLWVASLASVPLQMVRFSLSSNVPWLIIYSLLYLIWLAVLLIVAKKIGRFQLWSILLYPIVMVVFLVIFAISLFKKVFKLNVTWKGRSINTEERK